MAWGWKTSLQSLPAKNNITTPKIQKGRSVTTFRIQETHLETRQTGVVHVCTAESRESLFRQCNTHTHNGSEYAAITPTTSMSTDTLETLL